MEGPPRGFPVSLRLTHVTRAAESSRLQLDLVRRAFELLVPSTQHPVAKALDQPLVQRDGTSGTSTNGACRQRSAAAAGRVAVAGG
jgi:hypothetical protein